MHVHQKVAWPPVGHANRRADIPARSYLHLLNSVEMIENSISSGRCCGQECPRAASRLPLNPIVAKLTS